MTTYIAKKIFIASPSDLNEERKIFVDIITEVNVIKAHSLSVHLEALGWEETLPGKGRPQELINRELAQSDLFLMLLWQRWGTPTGRYSSGTEEEFHVATKLNASSCKPDIWVFFKTLAEEESGSGDIAKIQDFKKQLEKQNSLFYKTFNTPDEWQRLLRTLLCKWLDTFCIEKDTGLPPSKITEKVLIEVSYLDTVEGNSRPEIYFTIIDAQSLETWVQLTIDEKEQYMYDQLSQHLYLTLGCDPYRAIIRYKLRENQYLLLGAITFKYGASLEQSKIYIPNNLNQTFNQTEIETRLTDFWGRI